MDKSADFWQRESSRYYAASSQSAGRVYLIVSFGVAAVAAVAGVGISVHSAPVLALAPLVALFMVALVIRSTVESLYWAGLQQVADLRVAEYVDEIDLPVWRARGKEPPWLERFNTTTWIVLLLIVVALAWGADHTAVYLNAEVWTSESEHVEPWVLGLIVAFTIVCTVAVGITGILSFREAKSFLKDPESFASMKRPPKR